MIYPTGMITVEELQSIKLPIVNFAEGYKVAEVDVFLGKCADTLRNGYGLSVEEVEHHSFTSTYMGGYAMGDVNLLLDRIAWTLKNRPSGRRAMPTAQPYARPMPNQYPASQQYPPASQFPAAMPPQNQPVQSQYPMPSQPYPATPQSSAPMPLQAQPAPQYSMPQYPVQQPTTLGGLLSKARKNAEKFAKDNDLEGKLETGKSKAKEALSKAKNEASRAAQNLGDSIEEARSAYEEKKRVQEQDSERHATHTPQVWNKPLYDDSPSQRTMPIPPEDMPRMTFPGDRKNAGSDTESNKQTEIAEKKADSITDTRIVPEKTEPESTKENVSSEPEPAAEIVSKERAEVQTEVRTEEPASTVTIPVTPNDADSEPTVAMTESAVSSTPHWPSDKKQAQSDGYSDHHEVETHTATASDGFAALLEDKRKRTILIGCVAAFVLLLIALFCMSLSSEDSKNDKPATTPSYSHTTDSDDSADNNKPSTPSFEKVNTNSLKNRSVKEVTSELDGKSLSYKFLVDGGDGSDQTATVKTAVQNGEEWTVTEANQSMTDGEVTLMPGVSYCAACDGAFFRGKDVAVVGGGNSAVSEALLLSRLCRHVTLVHRRSTFRASAAELAALEKQDNVTFCRNSIVTELLGRERLTGIRLQNGRELEISGLFVCIGRTPVSALGGEQLRRTPDGYYCADETTRTGLPGVFAAGDVREKQLRQIVTAVSDGAAAAQQAEHYLGKTFRRAEI